MDEFLSPPLIVALTTLAIIVAIVIVAIRRYQTVDDAIRVMTAVGTIFGTLLGACTTYFFTSQQVVGAESRAQQAEVRAQNAENTLASVKDNAQRVITHLGPTNLKVLQSDIATRSAMADLATEIPGLSPDLLRPRDGPQDG